MKLEVEIGMYIRFKFGIRKVEKIENGNNQNLYYLDKDYISNEPEYHYMILENAIIGKPSYQLIDLVEIGDYVNKKEVLQIGETYSDATYTNKYKYLWVRGHQEAIKNEDIKSIITKEQFSQMEYKIGE